MGGGIYALPIASVLEVTEVGGSACIPTVPPDKAWVVNYHGDALPVVRSSALLDLAAASVPAPEHVLVISARDRGHPGPRAAGGPDPRTGGRRFGAQPAIASRSRSDGRWTAAWRTFSMRSGWWRRREK